MPWNSAGVSLLFLTHYRACELQYIWCRFLYERRYASIRIITEYQRIMQISFYLYTIFEYYIINYYFLLIINYKMEYIESFFLYAYKINRQKIWYFNQGSDNYELNNLRIELVNQSYLPVKTKRIYIKKIILLNIVKT